MKGLPTAPRGPVVRASKSPVAEIRGARWGHTRGLGPVKRWRRGSGLQDQVRSHDLGVVLDTLGIRMSAVRPSSSARSPITACQSTSLARL